MAIPAADRNRRGDCTSSSWNDTSANNAGKVSILTGEQLWSAIKDGQSTFDLSDAQVTILGTEQEGFLGQTLAVGDLDGDRYSDLIIGSPLHDDGSNADAGVVHLFFEKIGRTTMVYLLPMRRLNWLGQLPMTLLEHQLSHDIDDDGLDEVLVGTPYADEEALDSGSVSIFFGCE